MCLLVSATHYVFHVVLPRFSSSPFVVFTVPDSGGHLSNLLYTVIPCVVFGMVVAIVIIAICWKRHKQGPDAIKKNTRMTVPVLLPEVSDPSQTIIRMLSTWFEYT